MRDPRIDFKGIVGNRVFRAVSVKKDGTERTMVARLGVHKHTKGGTSTIKAHKNLIGCWDLQKQAYRSINIDTLMELKCGDFHWKKPKQ